MKIRLARKDDFKDWLNLRKALWPEYSLTELEMEMLETYATLSRTPAFVAEDLDGTICGLIEVSIRHTFGEHGEKAGCIEGLYVRPEYRKMGIGTKLISTAENWAAEQGCCEMIAEAPESYPLGPLAHQSMGYTRLAPRVPFSKSLGSLP